MKQTVNAFTPGVIEPSFGIDRIFTSLLEHAYYVRPKEPWGTWEGSAEQDFAFAKPGESPCEVMQSCKRGCGGKQCADTERRAKPTKFRSEQD